MKDFQDALATTEVDLLRAGIFCGHGYDSPHDEAVALVLAAADLPPTTGTEVLHQPFPEGAQQRLADFVRRRTQEREPTAYIIGRGWLGPLAFKSDARALIPRSPLMAAIEQGFAPWWQGDEPEHIVDVCCGGGSLGLLAAWAFPDSQVTLLDIDPGALSLAAENSALHALASGRLVRADLLSSLAASSVDIILANPPYVDATDMAELPPEYQHEPALALEAGHDGLALVHTLLQQASLVLRQKGVLFLEVGNSWQALENAYPTFPFTWLSFESGGHGVCVLSYTELQQLSAAPPATSQAL